jgi:hypothetical protein
VAAKRIVQTSGVTESEIRKPRRAAAVAETPESVLASISERFKDFPALNVLTRRFNDPSDPGSQPILLKDEATDACTNTEHQTKLKLGAAKCTLCGRPARRWYVRYFNLGMEGRHSQMREKGYVPVELKELQSSDDVSDLYRSKEDTFVRRGDRGQEILAKTPLEGVLYVKRLQRDRRMADSISPKKLKADLAEAAGAELGDEAGQTIFDGGIQVESVSRSRTTLGAEAELGEHDDE